MVTLSAAGTERINCVGNRGEGGRSNRVRFEHNHDFDEGLRFLGRIVFDCNFGLASMGKGLCSPSVQLIHFVQFSIPVSHCVIRVTRCKLLVAHALGRAYPEDPAATATVAPSQPSTIPRVCYRRRRQWLLLMLYFVFL